MLARVTGWCSWWVAWACGSQGGHGHCVAFLLLGALAWGGGTIWYARRRGYWPSALSARLFARLLGRRNPVTQVELPAVVIVPRRHRLTRAHPALAPPATRLAALQHPCTVHPTWPPAKASPPLSVAALQTADMRRGRTSARAWHRSPSRPLHSLTPHGVIGPRVERGHLVLKSAISSEARTSAATVVTESGDPENRRRPAREPSGSWCYLKDPKSGDESRPRAAAFGCRRTQVLRRTRTPQTCRRSRRTTSGKFS